jgi:hypothetical protein
MILGMSTATFTQFHVLSSLVGIFSGIVVVVGQRFRNAPPRFPRHTFSIGASYAL